MRSDLDSVIYTGLVHDFPNQTPASSTFSVMKFIVYNNNPSDVLA